jgi:hypothetical protein
MKVYVLLLETGSHDNYDVNIHKVVVNEQTAIATVEAFDARVAAYVTAREAIPNANGWPITPEAKQQLEELAEQFSDLKNFLSKYSPYSHFATLEYHPVEE